MATTLSENSASKDRSDISKYNDEALLAHLGKRPQFKRNLGLISALGLGSTLSLTWEGSLNGIHVHLLNGGSAGAIATVPIVTTGVLLQMLVTAELVSMMPLSGGAYNWVAILSPPKLSNFLSYVTGWILVIAWQTASAATGWLTSSILLSIAQVNYPDYHIEMWHTVLCFYAVVGLAVLFNTVLGRMFPGLEAVAFMVHVLGFFVFLIVVLYLAPKATAESVFGTFTNGGGFSSNAQSAIVGALGTMFGFNGIDAAVHMAEEVENAAVTIPRALIITVIISGITSWAMIIAVYFCMVSWEEVLTSRVSFPFISTLLQITHSTSGTTILVSIILMVGIFGVIGTLATASRMLWAFAREDGVPFSGHLSRIEQRSALPLYAIGVTATTSLILSLLNFGSETAFQALLSLTVASFYTTFLLASGLMLYWRIVLPSSSIKWGPFRMGRFGIPVTVLAMTYTVVGLIFSFFPQTSHFDLQTFNWSSVVFGGVLTLAIVWWLARARFTYIGPKMEL